MIDGMMERLGGTADLVAGDQGGETINLPGPRGANSGIPLVVADPSHETARDGSPMIVGASDWRVSGRGSL